MAPLSPYTTLFRSPGFQCGTAAGGWQPKWMGHVWVPTQYRKIRGEYFLIIHSGYAICLGRKKSSDTINAKSAGCTEIMKTVSLKKILWKSSFKKEISQNWKRMRSSRMLIHP